MLKILGRQYHKNEGTEITLKGLVFMENFVYIWYLCLFSILAWEIPWTEEPGGLQYMESQKSRTQLSD